VRRTRHALAIVFLAVVAASATTGCSELQGAAPRCDEIKRLAIVAQSVATAAYVPCVTTLRPGWESVEFDARSGRARFDLVSDRDRDHPVVVELHATCDVASGAATTPRADGTRTYVQLRSVSPRYAGRLSDVFAGGCVTYEFDFARGPHIALIDDFESAVTLLSRRDLALALRRSYDIELGES
jgi:hypothetical protein